MWLYSLVCVGPGQIPECWFSHDVAHLSLKMHGVGAHLIHLKVPKFLDTRKLCCNSPKIQTKRPNLMVFCQNGANGIANSEYPDQTAPLGAV